MMRFLNRSRAVFPWIAAFVGIAVFTTAGIAVGQAPIESPPPQRSSGVESTFSQLMPQPVTHQVSKPLDRIEMIVNTSRILTQDQRIPQTQVNNPDILGLTALSANQVQVFAKKPGVTQVNIWNEKNEIHTIDVMVYGDVQELARLLQAQFPKAALKLTPISTGVVIQGYVDDPNVQSKIVEIAQNYYPNVINSITVGGVQQVLLQVRVLEVSRTKLQALGVDIAAILQNGSYFGSGAAGLLRTTNLTGGAVGTTGREILTGRIASNGDNFFAFVEALKTNNLAKILADPNLTTVSGRPAFMNAGGEIPVLVPAGLGTVSIEYRRYGTQIDFVPIVLGNGVIRLEVRARVSELDDTRSITINGTQVPGFRVREADTASELKAGQTLAVAGLVQTRIETVTRGVPYVMDAPLLGTFFRRTQDQINEVELLIMVTPQLVDGLDPQDLCQLGAAPGSMTTNPNDWQLFNEGRIEVRPDQKRPAHMQQPYPIQGGNNAAAGIATGTVTTGVMTPAPAMESVPVPQRDDSPSAAPQRRSPPPTPAPTPAASPTEPRVRPAVRPNESSRNTSSDLVVPETATLPRVLTPPISSNESTTTPSQPGLIGPIGYDTVR